MVPLLHMCLVANCCTSSFLKSGAHTRLIRRAITMKRSALEYKGKAMSHFYNAKTANQEYYQRTLNNPNNTIVFAIGPAGTGKTLLACNYAIQQLQMGKFDKIVLTRPMVTVEEDLGFLPGNIAKKMDPWTRPIFDIFAEFYSQKEIDDMVYNNVIEISPLAYMRGRTFKRAFIIADEMQNSSPNQMMMLTTRIGFGSKMVITGDLKQSDKGSVGGLADFVDKFNKYILYHNEIEPVGIQIVKLTNSDIERHPVIIKILDIYNDITNNTIPLTNRDIYRNATNGIMPNTIERSSIKNITQPKMNPTYIDSDSALIPKKHMTKRLGEEFLKNGVF